MKNILLGLLPALMWGIQPLVMTKLGGKSKEKLMGMALGIFLVAILVSLVRPAKNLGLGLMALSFLDGLALSYGLVKQIKGLALLGVAKASPISTAGQLISASLVGALYFKEWTSSQDYILGLSGLTLIILGVAMTAFKEESQAQEKEDLIKGILILSLSSLGFLAYTLILKIAQISIWDALLPQGLAMVIGSYFLAQKEEPGRLDLRSSLKHILTGLFFAFGNISLMLSNTVNGLALGFTLTQMSVVIASLGGLLILKEERTRKEVKICLLGLVLVVLGGAFIGLTKA